MGAPAQEALRLQVVRAIRNEGLSASDACRTFGVGRTSVWRWLKSHDAHGDAELKPRGRPKSSTLLRGQAGTILDLLTDRFPDHFGLPFPLWTRTAVQQLIIRECGITPGLTTVGRYLRSWGLSPQQPLSRAWSLDQETTSRWLDDKYPSIIDRARRERAEIHWGDIREVEVPTQLLACIGACTGPVGDENGNGSRGRGSHRNGNHCHGSHGNGHVPPNGNAATIRLLVSTISRDGAMAFLLNQNRLSPVRFVEFLSRIVRKSDRKKFLICERHSIHRSPTVSRWLASHRDQIERLFLPECGRCVEG
jgi:transposase